VGLGWRSTMWDSCRRCEVDDSADGWGHGISGVRRKGAGCGAGCTLGYGEKEKGTTWHDCRLGQCDKGWPRRGRRGGRRLRASEGEREV
jgi:hypothetical protein